MRLLVRRRPVLERAARFAACGVLCVAGAALVQVAQGQVVAPAVQPVVQTPSDSAWLEPLIALLDADELAVREKATGDLQTDTRLSLTGLQARIADRSRPLTAEQSLRLSEVALRLFKETPRAAMGVSFTRRPVAGGVEIGMAIEGFDARRVLKPGDVIAEMDGVPIVSYDDARAAIVSHDPGDEMRLSILRGGEVVQAAIKLGNYKELQNRDELTDATYREAWLVRCERLAGSGDAAAGAGVGAVEAGVSLEQWQAARLAARRATLKRQQEEQTTGGGVAREDVGAQVMVGGGALRRAEDVPLIDFTDADQRRQSPQVRNVQAQIENLQAQVRLFERQLQNERNMNEVQRQNTVRNIQRYRELIRQLKAERTKMLRDEGGR